jgi:TnpA family transposase
LLPRLKAIAAQRLYLPASAMNSDYPNLEQQYDEMVRFTTALAERTADPEAILRRFTRGNL